jgi:hypothetical protein
VVDGCDARDLCLRWAAQLTDKAMVTLAAHQWAAVLVSLGLGCRVASRYRASITAWAASLFLLFWSDDAAGP